MHWLIGAPAFGRKKPPELPPVSSEAAFNLLGPFLEQPGIVACGLFFDTSPAPAQDVRVDEALSLAEHVSFRGDRPSMRTEDGMASSRDNGCPWEETGVSSGQ